MFGRAPKRAPASAPRGALPNRVEHRGSGDGAPKFPLSGAERRRWSHKLWLHAALWSFSHPLDRLALARAQEEEVLTDAAQAKAGGGEEAQ